MKLPHKMRCPAVLTVGFHGTHSTKLVLSGNKRQEKDQYKLYLPCNAQEAKQSNTMCSMRLCSRNCNQMCMIAHSRLRPPQTVDTKMID